MKIPRIPSSRLDGKRALVTGASSGIGFACAAALAQAGAHVVMASRGGKNLVYAVAALAGENLSVESLVLDVSKVAAIDAAIKSQEVFDVLVNAAGMARHSLAVQTTESDFDAVQALNFKGAYFITTAVARKLIASGKPGSLINISSQMGHVGGIERALYCATKHAIEGMTKAMAIEWGRMGIRVNTICPTFILTPLTQPTFDNPERRAWVEDKIKLGRVGQLEDVMGSVVYLASDASNLVTGTALMVDGGWTAY